MRLPGGGDVWVKAADLGESASNTWTTLPWAPTAACQPPVSAPPTPDTSFMPPANTGPIYASPPDIQPTAAPTAPPDVTAAPAPTAPPAGDCPPPFSTDGCRNMVAVPQG